MKSIIRIITMAIAMVVLPAQYAGAIEDPTQDYYDYISPHASITSYRLDPMLNNVWVCGRFANTIKIRYEWVGKRLNQSITIQPTMGPTILLSDSYPVYMTYTTHSNDIPDWNFSIYCPNWSNGEGRYYEGYVQIDVFYLPGW